jgi:hypothetical protein
MDTRKAFQQLTGEQHAETNQHLLVVRSNRTHDVRSLTLLLRRSNMADIIDNVIIAIAAAIGLWWVCTVWLT